MTDVKSKIVAQRMAELGFGDVTKPVVEPAAPRVRARRQPSALPTPMWSEDEPVVVSKADAMTEELLDMLADDLREVFIDLADGAGFEPSNSESASDLRGMVRWFLKMHFVRMNG